MTPSYLPIALRVYTERAIVPDRHAWKRQTQEPRIPDHILTLDTETTVDPSQRLLFGTARISKVVAKGHLLEARLIQEILFYADDLPTRDPDAFKVLRHHAHRNRLRLLSQQQFNGRVLWPLAVPGRVGLVGFNQPFDYSRIAYGAGQTRDCRHAEDRPRTSGMTGAFSFVLWRYQKADKTWHANRFRPRLMIKSLDRSRALKGFARYEEVDRREQIPEGATDGTPNPAYVYRGNFIDLHQLGFGMDDRRYSLARACEVYGVGHRKLYAATHGLITPQYIDYNRRDVEATEELFCKMMADYLKHPIDLRPSCVLTRHVRQGLSAGNEHPTDP